MDTKTPHGGRHVAITLVALGAAACCALAAWDSVQTLQSAAGSMAFIEAIIGIAGAIGTLAGLWVGLSHAVLVRARRSRRNTTAIRLARRLATPAVRRTLTGWTISGTLLVSPALAAQGTSDVGPDLGWSASTSDTRGAESEPDHLTQPDLGFGSPTWDTTTNAAPESSTGYPHNGYRYTVMPGDTLWSIADAHLRVGASTADIAAAADAWFRVNSDRILDPNLIHPGQLLISPEETP